MNNDLRLNALAPIQFLSETPGKVWQITKNWWFGKNMGVYTVSPREKTGTFYYIYSLTTQKLRSPLMLVISYLAGACFAWLVNKCQNEHNYNIIKKPARLIREQQRKILNTYPRTTIALPVLSIIAFFISSRTSYALMCATGAIVIGAYYDKVRTVKMKD